MDKLFVFVFLCKILHVHGSLQEGACSCADLQSKFDEFSTKFSSRLASTETLVQELLAENQQLKDRLRVSEDNEKEQEKKMASLENKINIKTEPTIETNIILNKSGNNEQNNEPRIRRLLAPKTPPPTTASRFAFSAQLIKHEGGLGANHPVKFDVVNLNEGGAFHKVLGVFICPVSGTYYFAASIMSIHHGGVQADLVLDDAILASMYAGAGAYYDQGTGFAITHCNQNQHVWVRHRTNTGTLVYGDHFSLFAGYLLWSDS